MKNNKNKLFQAKVLLFGEYGIIENSMGLCLPLTTFEGSLDNCPKKNTYTQKSSNKNLLLFYKFLAELPNDKNDFLNLDQFKIDIEKGLYFHSTIPQGFGVGSSGALVAAVYDKYAKYKIPPKTLDSNGFMLLKESFSIMENFFHGQSSGLDPLSCYLQEPLLISSKKVISLVGIPKPKEKGNGAVFLINSGVPGETKDMVDFFKKMNQDPEFRRRLKKEFIQYNKDCIEYFLKGDYIALFQKIKILSKWVLVHLQPMIPVFIQKLWEEGIETNKFYLKLCGSGGGGFFLGFSYDYEWVEKFFEGYQTQVIYRF